MPTPDSYTRLFIWGAIISKTNYYCLGEPPPLINQGLFIGVDISYFSYINSPKGRIWWFNATEAMHHPRPHKSKEVYNPIHPSHPRWSSIKGMKVPEMDPCLDAWIQDQNHLYSLGMFGVY